MSGPRNLVNLSGVAKGYAARTVLPDLTLGVGAGDRILRFPAWLVRAHPADVAAQVRAAVVAAGWRPPT